MIRMVGHSGGQHYYRRHAELGESWLQPLCRRGFLALEIMACPGDIFSRSSGAPQRGNGQRPHRRFKAHESRSHKIPIRRSMQAIAYMLPTAARSERRADHGCAAGAGLSSAGGCTSNHQYSMLLRTGEYILMLCDNGTPTNQIPQKREAGSKALHHKLRRARLH